MRRSTAVRLVVIGAAGLGVTAYGLSHVPRTSAPQPARCDDTRGDPSCSGSGQGSQGGGGAVGSAGGAARRDQSEGKTRASGSEAADAATPRGVVRGGFGEAGAAHGAGGGE